MHYNSIVRFVMYAAPIVLTSNGAVGTVTVANHHSTIACATPTLFTAVRSSPIVKKHFSTLAHSAMNVMPTSDPEVLYLSGAVKSIVNFNLAKAVASFDPGPIVDRLVNFIPKSINVTAIQEFVLSDPTDLIPPSWISAIESFLDYEIIPAGWDPGLYLDYIDNFEPADLLPSFSPTALLKSIPGVEFIIPYLFTTTLPPEPVARIAYLPTPSYPVCVPPTPTTRVVDPALGTYGALLCLLLALLIPTCILKVDLTVIETQELESTVNFDGTNVDLDGVDVNLDRMRSAHPVDQFPWATKKLLWTLPPVQNDAQIHHPDPALPDTYPAGAPMLTTAYASIEIPNSDPVLEAFAAALMEELEAQGRI